MDPGVDHGDRELHHGVVAGGRRHHLHHRALAQKDATMTTGNARTSPSLALARRIAAVGLLAGGPALTGERTRRHHRAGERGQRREGGDRRLRSRHQPAVNASRRPPVTAITAKTIRRTLLTRLVLAGGRWPLVNTSLPGSSRSAQNLVIDPQTPTTLYAATFGEGVFKSTDGGGSWNAVNTGLPTYPPGYYYPHSNVEALAIDPQTPT